jgi:alkylated DNA repair dioxygenase AlkB
MTFLDEIDVDRESHILDDGIDLSYDAGFLPPADADRLFQELLSSLPWRGDAMVRTPIGLRPSPRKISWHADEGCSYRYSGVTYAPSSWTSSLSEIRDRLEKRLGVRFNGVLGNLYASERDSVGAHADDEPEIDPDAPIASVSLGATRKFVVRHRTSKARHALALAHGSLLVMAGTTQRVSQHEIPKMKTPCGPRVNLTFRKMK